MWYNVLVMELDHVTVVFVWDGELKTYSAYVEGVAAYGEGKTKEEALESLKKALMLYIGEVGKDRFLGEIVAPIEYEELKLSSIV